MSLTKCCCSSSTQPWIYKARSHIWHYCLILHRKLPQWGSTCVYGEGNFTDKWHGGSSHQAWPVYLASQTALTDPGRGRGAAVRMMQLPVVSRTSEKNTKDRSSPHMSFLIITLEVQLIGLNKGTFSHLRCPRKPLLATVFPHSERHRLLQSLVL